MNVYWKLMSVAVLCLIAIWAMTLVFSPHSQAQTTSPALATYAYKVERIARNSKDIDQVLREDGKTVGECGASRRLVPITMIWSS